MVFSLRILPGYEQRLVNWLFYSALITVSYKTGCWFFFFFFLVIVKADVLLLFLPIILIPLNEVKLDIIKASTACPWILLHGGEKSRHRRIKKQRRDEYLAVTSQPSPLSYGYAIPLKIDYRIQYQRMKESEGTVRKRFWMLMGVSIAAHEIACLSALSANKPKTYYSLLHSNERAEMKFWVLLYCEGAVKACMDGWMLQEKCWHAARHRQTKCIFFCGSCLTSKTIPSSGCARLPLRAGCTRFLPRSGCSELSSSNVSWPGASCPASPNTDVLSSGNIF